MTSQFETGFEGLEADAIKANRPTNLCGVERMLGAIADKHGGAAVASVVRTLGNVRLTSPSIRKALETRVEPDLLPSVITLQRHRSGGCGCRKEAS